MSYGLHSGSASSGAVVRPLLLECDAHGEVVWMSDSARTVLGNPSNLAGTLRWSAPAPSAIRSWCVFEAKNTCLIGIQPESSGEPRREKGRDLRDLERDLLRHYFLLQRAERDLSNRADELKPGSGARSVRQIELERQRLGRELHTGVGQLLTAIRLQLEMAGEQLRDMPESITKAISRMSTLATDALDQVRAISHRMHPPEWQRLKLERAIEESWETSGIPQRFDAVIHVEPLPQEPEQEIKTLIYRAAQEAFSNIAQHSKASRVELTLRTLKGARGEEIALAIRDNGAGFDVTSLFKGRARISSGIGLRSIREQAAALGARFMIESGPQGTTFTVLAPFMTSET